VAKPPAFQFYAREWLAEDTLGLTLEEKGAHIDLLALAWLDGGIPTDAGRLARILRVSPRQFAKLWPAVAERWHPEGDRLVNRKMEEYRGELASFKAERSEAGRRGAEKRWGTDG
jgi:uncharacterized protein YdaU (DUF1376 family)